MSPGRYGMSRRAAKVKTGLEPPPWVPGGRFRGTYELGPPGNELMTCEGGVPAPCTRLQHLGDSEVLLEQKRRRNTPGLPGPRRRVRNGPPQELVCPRYRLPEPEGVWVSRSRRSANHSFSGQTGGDQSHGEIGSISDSSHHPSDWRRERKRVQVQVVPKMTKRILVDCLGIRDKGTA